MKCRNRRINSITAIAAVAFLLSVSAVNLAQDRGQFKEGDRVEVDVNMSSNPNSEYATWRKATVVKVEMWQSAVAGYHLKTEDGREIVSSAKYMRGLSDAEKNTGGPPAARQPNEDALKPGPPEKDAISPQKGMKFKIGDRVLTSPAMLKEDKYYQPCTIISINTSNSYGVRCDPFNGISFMDYNVREDFVRAWPDAKPAPTFDCSFAQPPDVNKKTAPASAAVFKRIIYEWQAVSHSKTKVGVVFETFQIGTPFRNVYARNKNALLYEGFPQNAMIYPIKTRMVTCEEGNEYNYRSVYESGYACAKNRFGDWSCGVDGGAPRRLDRQNVPKQ